MSYVPNLARKIGGKTDRITWLSACKYEGEPEAGNIYRSIGRSVPGDELVRVTDRGYCRTNDDVGRNKGVVIKASSLTRKRNIIYRRIQSKRWSK